ncbi:hypothetical protein TVAG_271520 [Trichomonas vaginalis G3]|uniref:Uncharacterized protein n=1 Tax=Trichomonas vaginalis (strain ATCC PRA-98 / G3) TaxID=412133 RepID=A2E5P9_TRIV3|nr:armadillo (ARM) repeat-containing protein family [Trichomonas vaginalis G3]EAY11969.1 hypothetical protein TVAG_271520 [Trichomonas vaginalis G3]KAI5524866.1 armadillo (ARM) repeat-containing protein family [Trichomonas vaginalis G3]|eukprot:XP_001324192.1 hypothetical protein [Trichomonas vaginalis G3]
MSNETIKEELNFGFIYGNLTVAVSQITEPDLESRKMGFISLINATEDQEGFENLYLSDIFHKLIESFNEFNLQIIGMVCAAYRHLYSLRPSEGDKYASEIPVDFLLNLQPDPDVIQFFTALVDNSFDDVDYAGMLLANSNFHQSIGSWLENQNEPIYSAALGLLCSFAVVGGGDIDFSIVTPFTDVSYSPNVRALAYYIVSKTSPSDEVISGLFSILEQANLGQDVFQVIADVLEEFPDQCEQYIPSLIDICIQNFNITSTANLLALLERYLTEENITSLINALFAMKMPPVESLAFIFELISSNNIQLQDNQLILLGKFYGTADNKSLMDVLQDMFVAFPDYMVSEDAQQNYANALDRDYVYSIKAFNFVTEKLLQVPVIPDLLDAYQSFVSTNQTKLTKMQAQIDEFMNNHQ